MKLLSLSLLLLSSITLSSQKFEPVARNLVPDQTVSSKIMGRDYQLYISFPGGYSSKDTTRYPVLYVLDARRTFPVISAARSAMDISRELEKVIIVCIGSGVDDTTTYINRTYDYTPSDDTIVDRENEAKIDARKGTVRSGGAAKFLDCLTQEIIPYVDKHYNTNGDRGICGHSYGGLFATYCLLHSKGVFKRYAITSPSLWWNDDEILKQADSMLADVQHPDIPPSRIFISVGKKEGYSMVPKAARLATLLEDSELKNVSVTWQIFEDETHFSVWPESLSRTLTVLYGIKN